MLEELDQLIALQKKKLLECARCVLPCLTEDDLLQLCDFPELENHPFFRHQEGVLEGLLAAKMAYLSKKVAEEKEVVKSYSFAF